MRERRAPLRRAIALAAASLTSSLLWLSVGDASPVNAAVAHSFPAHAQRADTQGTTPSHNSSPAHPHKEGSVAVVASVLGIIAIVVGIVLLGSISARRRMGGKPVTKGWSWRGPPDGGRGLFG